MGSGENPACRAGDSAQPRLWARGWPATLTCHSFRSMVKRFSRFESHDLSYAAFIAKISNFFFLSPAAPPPRCYRATRTPSSVSAGRNLQTRLTQQLITFYSAWANIRPKTQSVMRHKLKGRWGSCTSKPGNKDILSQQQVMCMENYLQPGKCEAGIFRIIFVPV